MNVGSNYLREHIIQEARIHYVIINGGGIAPNVVPPYAESLYMIRAPRPDQLKPIFDRVVRIAQGAAMMTDAELEYSIISGASNLVFNDTIVDVLHEKMNEIAPPTFSEEERDFARELAATFPKGDGLMGGFAKLLGPNVKKMMASAMKNMLMEQVLPAFKKDIAMPGSSDVGDVSWVIPTGQIMTTCHAVGTPGHSWQMVVQSGMSIGHKGMLYAGKVLAATAVEFMQDADLLQKAKDEYAERLKETPYVQLIPDDVTPPF